MPEAKDSGYEGYQDTIAEIDGNPVDKEARAKAREAAGVTSKSFDYSGKDNEWNGTVYFQEGVPFRINFYVWSATKEKMNESLSKDLGFPVQLVHWHGGNGHYSAEIEKVEE